MTADVLALVRAELERIAVKLGHPGIKFEVWRT